MNSKFCIAILAHEKEEVLDNQIKNINKFIPNSTVVLYNSSPDVNFGKRLNVPICPSSRHLQLHERVTFLKDIMLWLPQTGIEYDYLMFLDSDVMFIRDDFSDFMDRIMKGSGAIGINMGIQRSPKDVPHWVPGQQMWREFHKWQPLLNINYICGALNSMQVFRKEIVVKMFNGIDLEQLNQLIRETEVFSLEEILYATLAVRAGARVRSYPYYTVEYVRLGTPLTIEDIKNALKEVIYFVHPIARDLSDPARQFITSEL